MTVAMQHPMCRISTWGGHGKSACVTERACGPDVQMQFTFAVPRLLVCHLAVKRNGCGNWCGSLLPWMEHVSDEVPRWCHPAIDIANTSQETPLCFVRPRRRPMCTPGRGADDRLFCSFSFLTFVYTIKSALLRLYPRTVIPKFTYCCFCFRPRQQA